MKSIKSNLYFQNLDGLRFFCFLSVFFYHSFATHYNYINNSTSYQFIKYRLFGNGNLGVNFFFVLSGFLITFLLLKEKHDTKKINIKNFYIRRILRIWPLYFFCIFFGFVLFPLFKHLLGGTPNETAHPLNYIVFLSNFDYIKHGTDSSELTILWSVSIEEQFYLIWPLIIAFINNKLLPYVFFLFLLGSFIFRLLHAQNGEVIDKHTLSCISDLTIGGMGAYLCFYSQRFLNYLKNLGTMPILLLYTFCIIILLFRKELLQFNTVMIALDRLIISILFLFIILEQNYTVKSLFKISQFKNVSKLGLYTYSLYCLHMIGILIAFTLLSKFKLNNTLWGLLFGEGALSLGTTVILAYFSFHYFEKRFLNLKSKFEIVKTENLALNKDEIL